MALIKCSECGKEISDKAKACIHCGCPIEEQTIKYIEQGCVLCINCGQHSYYKSVEMPGETTITYKMMNQPCYNCGGKLTFLRVVNAPTYNEIETNYEYLNNLVGGTINKELHHEWAHKQIAYDKRVAEEKAREQAELLTHAECPYCKSRQTEKASATSRWLSTGLFGLASRQVGKQWYCRNCKSYF